MNFPGLAVALLLAQAQTPTPAIEVRPSSTNVSIGERFQVVVELRGPTGVTYDFPNEISDGSVDLIQNRSSSTAESAVYDAQVFAIGESGRIPEIEIQYRAQDGTQGTVRSRAIPLNIVSTIDPAEQNPAPADFAPPQPIQASREFWIASGLAGLLLAALLFFLIRRLRFPKKPSDPSVTPAVTPEEEAVRSLDKLGSAQAARDPKAFYIQIIQILKQYLERRLEAPILEMTSTETLGFVKAHSWTAPHAVALRDLVTSADLAKFGGATDASHAEKQIQLVRDVVSRVDRLRRAEIALSSSPDAARKTA